MNRTMEDSQQTSEYVYEDEQVFLTDQNNLFLKEGLEGEQKLCEVSADAVEDKVAELKNVFADLEQRIHESLEKESLTGDDIAGLREDVKTTVAIGNFNKLMDKIEDYESDLDESDAAEKEIANSEAEPEEKPEAEQEDTAAENTDEGSKPPESSETENDEEPQDDGSGESPDHQEATSETEEDSSDDDSLDYYREIVDKAQDLSKQSDWSYVSAELDELSRKWSDGPDVESDEVKKLFEKFNKAVDTFEDRREEHYEQQEKKRQQNLEKKKKLLKEFEGIVSNETWTATRRVSQMKSQWNSIGQLPSDKGEGLDERFEELVDTFDDHKVDRLVQKRQQEEDNLMGKLTVLEKMERVAENINHETTEWEEIAEKFEDLTKQWKEIGKVPREKSDEVWERYKKAQDNYYDQKYKYDPDHQSKVDRFSHKKEKICEEAEQLVEMDDIATAARKVNKLHHRWKKVGNLPQRLEDKLWNRFKSATDAFNEKKANNQDKIEEQEEEHYQQKLELIDKANAVKDTDDFEKGHSKMQSFMDRWKKIGPVPRKKSNKIWKKFKGAMDEFYDRRREHFKEVEEERKENLERKKELLEKLHELGQHEDPIEAVDIAKEVQEKFKNVGYVPIEKKNEMWKKYREACDVIYDRMRAAKSGDKFDQELAKANLDQEDRNEIQKLRKKYKKLKKEVRSLEKEAIRYKEKKTYFTPSGDGNSLLDEVDEKIASAEEKIETKEEKMDELTKKMDLIRRDSGD
ncbi:DUF349 domain-containing protein [Fodinibius salinus]|uniref:DUF349 domain-containing protein n=1 Tax=Fodinibius salinus TaxID=860790 RepID=UPI0011E6D83A|nr:DUF349 domain-containing protein [Fodinibius salinus]